MIEGEKITLTIPEKQHLKQMMKWRNTPELKVFSGEYRELSYSHQINWWKDKVLKDDLCQYFVIKPIGEDKIIGTASLVNIHPVYKKAQFGILIGDKKYRNNGFGSDALRTIMKFGFKELNLNRIWSEVYSNNIAIEIYRHLGFKDEGVMRQSVYKNGSYLDSHILAILKEEYDRLYGK